MIWIGLIIGILYAMAMRAMWNRYLIKRFLRDQKIDDQPIMFHDLGYLRVAATLPFHATTPDDLVRAVDARMQTKRAQWTMQEVTVIRAMGALRAFELDQPAMPRAPSAERESS